MKKKKKFFLTDYINVLFIIILVLTFTALNRKFISLANINNILNSIGPLLIMGVGVALVLFIGSIDLSIGSICSMGSVLFVMLLLKDFGYFAYILVLLFGITAGFINGILYSKLRITSFILTIGTMMIWQSIAFVLSRGTTLQYSKESRVYIEWLNVKFGVIPTQLLVSLVIVLILFIIQDKTKLGKYMYAIGVNERAAKIAGVQIDFTKIMAFTICGACSALSGIMLSVKLNGGIPAVGEPYLLLVIAAVALGGTSLSGGKGNVLLTILGVLIVVLIQNGMSVVGIDPFWHQIVFGLLIIVAIYMSAEKKKSDAIVK